MRSAALPMTIDEFHLLPRRLGWKYEYFDGAAHVTPASVVVECVVDVVFRLLPHPYAVQAVGPDHRDSLIEAYRDAFEPTPDYLDWPPEAFSASAGTTIDGYFSGAYGAPSPTSRLLLHEGEVVGAALVVVSRDERHCLKPVFVRSARQRRGVATALASSVICALHDLGQSALYSTFLLANEPSRSWHRRLGFVELPNELLTRYCLHHLKCNSWRLQKLGQLTPAMRQELMAEQAFLEAQLRGFTEAH